MVKDQSQQIERQSQQIDRQSQEIQRLTVRFQFQSQLKDTLTYQDKVHSKLGERLMSKAATNYRDPSRQRRQRGSINLMCSTPFEWKIPNFRALLAKAELGSLVSEPFYLVKGGYKYLMQIKICLKEGPMDETITLRIYIKVVPGEFDELLSWPCKEKVRVTLIDQQRPLDKRRNISHVIHLEKGSRPLHDDDHKYRCTHVLSDFGIEFRSYIKNGTILIRVNRE